MYKYSDILALLGRTPSENITEFLRMCGLIVWKSSLFNLSHREKRNVLCAFAMVTQLRSQRLAQYIYLVFASGG